MIVANGSTDVTTYFVLRDSTAHAPKTDVTITDIDLYYLEQGAAMAAKVDATALAAADSAHADNKAYHCGLGLYRVDWPDAAFDSGIGKRAYLIVVCTGVDTTYLEVLLSPPVNVAAVSDDATAADNLELACDNYSATRGLSGTALPAAAANAAGGLPISSAGSLALDTKLANTNEVTAARMGALTDLIDGGRLDLLIDAIKAMTDKIGTVTNSGGTATIGAILGDFANSALAGRVSDARMGALTDWINGGRLDLILDDILLDTGTTLQGELDGIQADTEDIQARLPAALVGGRMNSNVAAVNNVAVDGAGTEVDPWGPAA